MSAIILPYKGIRPQIDASAFVAPNAAVIGQVEIGPEVSIWYNCSIRGDVHEIKIGAGTNVQDNSVFHGVHGHWGTYVGANVTIGHGCIIHGCTIEDDVLIGMGATVMEGAVVEQGGWVAAGALVTPKKKVGKNELWAGSPAKFLRKVNAEEAKLIAWIPGHYRELAEEHKKAIAGEG
jgi:carbonic anhydrase/acetyltransferase-like protein (isoleucine patch superfamily)